MIGKPNVDRITVFSESLYNLLRISNSNYYEVENNYSIEGVNRLSETLPSGLKMMVNYHVARYQGIIELIDLDTGKILKTWAPDGKAISREVFKMGGNIKYGEELFYNHPIMLPDSSIIANTIGSSIFKIDSQSKLVWIKTIKSHHSLELDENGFIWGCGKQSLDSLPSQNLHFKPEKKWREDTVFKLDPSTGEAVYTKSMIDILVENDMERMLFANGYLDPDPIHLNDVQPATSDGAFWKKGDLLLSSKHLSTVFLYRPSTNKVIWHQTGPWLNQHDPDFYEEDKIVVFGNQNLRGEQARHLDYSRIFNNVYIYNFNTDSTTTPYEQLLSKEHIRTYTQGRSEILSNGDVFVEETDNGRIIIGDSLNKKLEFVRRADADNVYILHWSRILQN